MKYVRVGYVAFTCLFDAILYQQIYLNVVLATVEIIWAHHYIIYK